LADFAAAKNIDYTMFADAASRVIREYGVLNTLIPPEDVPFHGVPFPGVFLVGKDGVITDKLFNPHFANRDCVEAIVDRFLGRVVPGEGEPIAHFSEDDGVEVTAFLRGGGGVLRMGPLRRLIVRFSLPPGLHIYGEPVPEGMVATQIEVEGPDGFCCEAIESPPTELLNLPGVDAPLHVWDGIVDFVLPVFGNSVLGESLLEETHASIEVKINVRYQACDDAQCFIPRTRTLELNVPLGEGTRPAFKMLEFMGGEVIDMDTEAHFERLAARQGRRQ
jgi:hypothetical protein